MSQTRRAPALLLALLCLLTALSVVGGSPADAAAQTDPRLGRGDCALTGRVFVPGAGCARHRCVPGATIFKEGKDAELCQLRGRKGAEFARPISEQRCRQLGRVWVGQINSCASNPQRNRVVVAHARQCRNRAATYLNHREEEGYYDECVGPGKLRTLQRLARRERASVNKVALQRGRANCSYRPGYVISGGTCVRRDGPPPAADLGGFYMVGDSVSWRADDELAARRPDWTLDLRPGRRLNELGGRLEWYRANHGDPDQLVIQLGTNRRRDYDELDFRATMATVPDTVPVLFLLPFRQPDEDNAGPVAATKKYATWMRNLAGDRPNTCLADWPSYASAHLDHLVDGEHPGARHEDWYARYVTRMWTDCATQLGL